MDSNTKTVIKCIVMSAIAMLCINLVAFAIVLADTDLSGRDFSFAFNDLQFYANGRAAGLKLGSVLYAVVFIAIFFSLFFRAVKNKEIVFKNKI